MTLFPRVAARVPLSLEEPAVADVRHGFDIPRLDEMLCGGVPAASSMGLIGATGTGKTSLGLSFLAAGAARGERGLYFGFHESAERIQSEGEGIGLELGRHARSDVLDLVWRRPFNNLLDRVLSELLEHVERRAIRRLFIDGIEGLEVGSPFPESVPELLAALTHRLHTLGVTTMVSIESEMMGTRVVPQEPWSALVDNAMVLRYVERRSVLRRLLWIVKLRGSGFDASIREFAITSSGIEVCELAEDTHGALSGASRRGPEELRMDLR